MIWGIVCAAMVYLLSGTTASFGWTTGYLLELVFSVENVFVFHVVCQGFRVPANLTQKALFVVIIGQIAFQALFFMGLAHWLHESFALPYVLGAWLLYVGFQASQGHASGNFDARESGAFKFFHSIIGKRLSPEFPKDGHVFFHTDDGLASCTMLLPLTICLIVVDVLFEVDVTLTKIETLDNSFMDFSSSVVAACAVPELYFVARKMFERYNLLQYGVAFVLLFYGVQLLFHRFFELPALVGIIVVMGVMVLCIAFSDEEENKTDAIVKQATAEASGDVDRAFGDCESANASHA